MRVKFFGSVSTGIKDAESLVPQVLLIAPLEIVNSNQKRVVHDLESLQQLNILLELLEEKLLLLNPELEMSLSAEPVEVLQGCSRIRLQIFLLEVSANSRAFEVEGLVNVSVRGEDVVHDHEVNLLAVGHLDTVKPVELRKECIRVVDNVLVVFLENLSKKLVLGMVDCFDDILIIAGEVEEAAALSRGS